MFLIPDAMVYVRMTPLKVVLVWFDDCVSCVFVQVESSKRLDALKQNFKMLKVRLYVYLCK